MFTYKFQPCFYCVFIRRCAALQVRGLRQGVHTEVLPGITLQEDPRPGGGPRLQREEGQALRLRGLRSLD